MKPAFLSSFFSTYRSAYLSGFLLLCLCPAAFAQLPDQLILDQQLDSVTQQLDDVIEEVQESVAQQVDTVVNQIDSVTQDAVASSLDSISSDLEGVIDTTMEEAVVGAIDGVEGIVHGVADTLARLPDSLGDVLPVVDREGKNVFVEVKVEQNWYALEREWLLVVDEKSRVDFSALNADIIEQRQFPDLGMRLIRFRVPAQLDSLAALKKRLPAQLHNQLDRNHIYIPQIQNQSQTQKLTKPRSPEKTQQQKPPAVISPPSASSACDSAVKIGMIDTAINTQHAAFANSRIKTHDFAGENFDAPRAHGTAVAGLLVGKSEQLTPLLPSATLYAASVFYPRTEHVQGATMMNLVRALNWLAAEHVQVINMSLSGPDNKILATVIEKLIHSGTTIIAAAGNEGPAAPPVFPAAYNNVIAVTAVDEQQRSYRWANRGAYIDFAAMGVGVLTARASGDFGTESGTSMAAPVVSALFACETAAQQKYSRQLTLEQLAKRAIDLGDKGRDPVFGYGLLRAH